MKRLLKFLSTTFSFLFLLGLLGICGVVGIFYYYGSGLPDYQQLKTYEPPVVTRVYANDGRMFGEYAFEKRLFVPIQSIPTWVKKAFISAEDKTFYSHVGVDFLGIIRSAFLNIKRFSKGRRLMGGSTITQQVARNFLLSETSTLVSFERKIKETILSFRIENAYTKDHIFELYLNEIYLGNRSYGVAAAALNYFNKSLDELTIAEAAYLAALPKAPSRYHPEKNHELAVERRNWVLQRMHENGYITAQERQEGQLESLVMRDHTANTIEAGFFSEEIRRLLLAQFGQKGLYESGLAVRTSMDPHLQALAQKSLRKGLEDYDRRHGWRGAFSKLKITPEDIGTNEWLKKLKELQSPPGAGKWKKAVVLKLHPKRATIGVEGGIISSLPLDHLKWARKWISSDQKGPSIQSPQHVFSVGDVVLVERAYDGKGQPLKTFHLRQIPKVSGAIVAMDPHTGRVLAMTGGYHFAMSQFNRATQALRQIGSAIKTFIYLSALEKGLTPSSILEDAPIVIDLGWNLGLYKPKNYDNKFLGSLTVRRALELSRNTPTMRIVHEIIGVSSVSEICERFGLYETLGPQLAMALGAGETTLLKLTNAHAMLVNGGKHMNPIFIDRVQDRHGKTIFMNESRQCRGCDHNLGEEKSPPHLLDKRETIVDPVHAYQIVSILEGAVQRGTSRRAKILNKPVAGKTGTTNEFRDAFFIGFSPDLVVGVYIGFDAPMSLGNHEGGARAAAPIFVDFMKEALKDSPATPFRIPPGTSLVRVNPYSGVRASPGDKSVILEAFKAGSGPEDTSIYAGAPEKNGSIGSGSFY